MDFVLVIFARSPLLVLVSLLLFLLFLPTQLVSRLSCLVFCQFIAIVIGVRNSDLSFPFLFWGWGGRKGKRVRGLGMSSGLSLLSSRERPEPWRRCGLANHCESSGCYERHMPMPLRGLPSPCAKIGGRRGDVLALPAFFWVYAAASHVQRREASWASCDSSFRVSQSIFFLHSIHTQQPTSGVCFGERRGLWPEIEFQSYRTERNIWVFFLKTQVEIIGESWVGVPIIGSFIQNPTYYYK